MTEAYWVRGSPSRTKVTFETCWNGGNWECGNVRTVGGESDEHGEVSEFVRKRERYMQEMLN